MIRNLSVPVFLIFGLAFLANNQRPATNDKGNTAIPKVEISGFTVIGIEARTNNAKEATPDGIIGKQWQKFFSEGIVQRIPDRGDTNLYALYFEYASDHNGDYSFMIGAKVKDGTRPPAGMVVKRVRAGEYALITSDQGPLPKVTPAAWQRIFELEEKGLKRAYRTDFELYDQRAQNPENGQVDIYIGVK